MTTPTTKRLGRYILEEPLGQGSEGRVFHARQENAAGGMACVVKLANPEGLQPKHFLEEARRAMELGQCPYITSIIDADVVDGTPFFVMKYVDGADLGRILAHRRQANLGPLPLVVTCTILRDMADALHFAHVQRKIGGKSLRMIHRDIKPANTLVTFDGYSQLLDFGISTRADDKSNRSSMYGTPRYMSPEHIYGPICPAMDIYSLGVVAWEMVEGRIFRGERGSQDHIAAIIEGTTPPLQNEATPRELAALIESCLSSDSNERPTAKEFVHALKKCPGYERDTDAVGEFVEQALNRLARSRATRMGALIPQGLLEEKKTTTHLAATPAPSPTEPTMLNGEEPKTVAWQRPENGEEDAPQLRRKQRMSPPVVSLPEVAEVAEEAATTRLPPTTPPTELLPPPPAAADSRPTPHRVIARDRATSPSAPTTPSTPATPETLDGEPCPEHAPPEENRRRLPFALILITATLAAIGLGAGAALWIVGG